MIDYYRTQKEAVPLEDVPHLLAFEDLPETHASQKEYYKKLYEVVRKLDPPFQQVIACRFVSHLSYEETAQVMNKKIDHVRVLQFRALQKLRKLLEIEGDFNEKIEK